jgi:hypothetical protein
MLALLFDPGKCFRMLIPVKFTFVNLCLFYQEGHNVEFRVQHPRSGFTGVVELRPVYFQELLASTVMYLVNWFEHWVFVCQGINTCLRVRAPLSGSRLWRFS